MDDPKHSLNRIWDMVEANRFCLLVTYGFKGMSARPMTAIPRSDQNRIYMLVARDSKAYADVVADSQVLVNFTNGTSQFVVLQGEARVSEDRALVRQLWNPGAQAFWPKGAEDPEVVAIEIEPQRAEYWDGKNAILAGVKMAMAIITRTQAEFGDNEKVTMSPHTDGP